MKAYHGEWAAGLFFHCGKKEKGIQTLSFKLLVGNLDEFFQHIRDIIRPFLLYIIQGGGDGAL